MKSGPAKKALIKKGVKDAIPVVTGYIPIAIAFGVLASQVGLDLTEAASMSIFVFAGSAQLIAVGMIGAGSSVGEITVMAFLVNLRHLLMSAALSPYLKNFSKKQLAWFGFQMTDETFAVHSTKFRAAVPPALESFALNGTAQLSWVAGTVIGILAGSAVKDVEGLGLDYALPAMFITLVFMQLRNSIFILVSAVAGSAAILFHMAGQGSLSTIVAAILAATSGVIIERWRNS